MFIMLPPLLYGQNKLVEESIIYSMIVKKNISQGSEIYYNPYNRRRGRNDSDMRTPRIGLAHELQHSFDVDKKVATYERTKNGILLMDIRAINTENRIRKVIGEPKRTMYGTQKVPKELLE